MKSELIKVQDEMGLVRDPSNNQILNLNIEAYESRIKAKKLAEENARKIQTLEGRVNELTELIKNLIEKEQNGSASNDR